MNNKILTKGIFDGLVHAIVIIWSCDALLNLSLQNKEIESSIKYIKTIFCSGYAALAILSVMYIMWIKKNCRLKEYLYFLVVSSISFVIFIVALIILKYIILPKPWDGIEISPVTGLFPLLMVQLFLGLSSMCKLCTFLYAVNKEKTMKYNG